jgi:Ulp1 family protease
MYPPEGRGRITINTEDYMCLGQDQFLNDVIIDFYLKYLLLNLPKEQQDKVHIFSTFFYKRLTTKPIKASRYDLSSNGVMGHVHLIIIVENLNRVKLIQI